MKRVLILGIISLLQSCYHNGCFYSPQSVSCYYRYSDISRIQNVNDLGNTSQGKRWWDIKDCMGISIEKDNIFTFLNKEIEDSPQKFMNSFNRLKKINQSSDEYYSLSSMNYIRELSLCLKNRGYIIFSKAECYENNLCK